MASPIQDPGGAQAPAAPVLVVDDDQLIHTIVSEHLRKADCTPLAASSFQEAEALLPKKPFMAFIDVTLPDQSGDRFCRRLRLDKDWWDLPVIMITSAQKSEVIRRCFVAGADDFLLKPLNEKHVLAKVEAVRLGLGIPPRLQPPGRSVLLATDKVFFKTVLARLIEHSGYAVRVCGLPSETLSAIRAAPPDVVVTDVNLGGQDPAAWLKLLHEAFGKAKAPVIAIASGPVTGAPLPEIFPYDVEDDLEHLVRHLNGVLTGATIRADRRMKPRVPLYTGVQFRLYGEREWFMGFSYDLSESGVFVRTLTPLAAKAPVEMAFRLEDAGETLECKGLVTWCNTFGPRTVFSYPYGMGIYFSDFPADKWSKVQEFVRKNQRATEP